ncbi:MAG: hypothetical protein HQK99_03425 [Nitrospirae bacterium]|nr:hypothetical protein [Nitrospirota bacterium]
MDIKPIEEIADKYANNTILRGLITAIPVIGGVLDATFSGDSSKRWQEKVGLLLDNLHENFNRCDEDKMDKKFVNSDEFEALLISIIEAIRKVHEKGKIELFANILTSSCLKKYSQEYRKERFIHLVDNLSMIHIAILNLFRNEMSDDFINANKSIILTSENISNKLSIDLYDCEVFCSELISSGLLFDPDIGTRNYKRGSYSLHKSAIRFFDFLFIDNPTEHEAKGK